MQKLYQTFVALAAQLQGVHENVKVSSENVLNGSYFIFLYENVLCKNIICTLICI